MKLSKSPFFGYSLNDNSQLKLMNWIGFFGTDGTKQFRSKVWVFIVARDKKMPITIILTKLKKPAIFLLLTAIIAGCASQPVADSWNPPGFFMGLVHGYCILFSLIGSIFIDVRIYAFPNSGGWYDFGYFIGALMFLGSISRS